ncbi:hypothetical protein D9M72_584050 [compost metagenome]
MAERLQRQRDDGGGDTGAAGRNDRFGKIDAGVGEGLAKRREILERSVFRESAGGKAVRPGHMARAHAGTRLRLLAIEASGTAGIGDLDRAIGNDFRHPCEGGHGRRIEIDVERYRLR